MTFPVAFSQAPFAVTAMKSRDHGGGIPNLLSKSATALTIELEWIVYNGGSGEQKTYSPSNVMIFAIGA
jgi:hypothetical protein